MPITAFPLTRAVASTLDVRASSPSTNAELRHAVAAGDDRPHLSVLLTENQTAGRGRLDRVWTAPPGTALAISVLLRTLPTSIEARGWVPLLAGAAMADAVTAHLGRDGVGVKWPNDVLVDEHKICGILAELCGDAIVLGAGINTRMSAAELPVPTATSFAVLGVTVDPDAVAAHFVGGVADRLARLCAAGDAVASGLHAEVSARCVSLGRVVEVIRPGGQVLRAHAVRLDPDGCIVLRDGATEHRISSGDIVHARLR